MKIKEVPTFWGRKTGGGTLKTLAMFYFMTFAFNNSLKAVYHPVYAELTKN